MAVVAATRIARVDGGASRRKSHGRGRSAIVLQGAELGIGVVQVADIVEVTGRVAAQVITIRVQDAVTVSSRVFPNNAVLEDYAAVKLGDAANAVQCGISADGAVVDRQFRRDNTGENAAASQVSIVPANGTVVNRRCTRVRDAATLAKG